MMITTITRGSIKQLIAISVAKLLLSDTRKNILRVVIGMKSIKIITLLVMNVSIKLNASTIWLDIRRESILTGFCVMSADMLLTLLENLNKHKAQKHSKVVYQCQDCDSAFRDKGVRNKKFIIHRVPNQMTQTGSVLNSKYRCGWVIWFGLYGISFDVKNAGSLNFPPVGSIC